MFMLISQRLIKLLFAVAVFGLVPSGGNVNPDKFYTPDVAHILRVNPFFRDLEETDKAKFLEIIRILRVECLPIFRRNGRIDDTELKEKLGHLIPFPDNPDVLQWVSCVLARVQMHLCVSAGLYVYLNFFSFACLACRNPRSCKCN